jgi:hypothetical protein
MAASNRYIWGAAQSARKTTSRWILQLSAVQLYALGSICHLIGQNLCYLSFWVLAILPVSHFWALTLYAVPSRWYIVSCYFNLDQTASSYCMSHRTTVQEFGGRAQSSILQSPYRLSSSFPLFRRKSAYWFCLCGYVLSLSCRRRNCPFSIPWGS